MAERECPKCKSVAVAIGYPDIKCLTCGWNEPLIDFPISWDWHRHYCREYGLRDPGPCEPPEHPELKATEERLEKIEQTLTSLTTEDLRQFKLKGLSDRMRGLERGLALTQRAMAGSIRSGARKKKSTKGVPL